MKRIYLDNAATTPLLPEVMEVMQQSMVDHFGNPSSIHHYGRISKAAIEGARKKIANCLNCSIGEIFFVSSATEANNMILHQSVDTLDIQQIISSPTEHPCVLKTIEGLNNKVDVKWLTVDSEGNINLDELKTHLSSDKKSLVSLMHSNNEIGTLHPFEEISKICVEHKALFHSDTVQSIGKIPIDLSQTTVSFLSASAHKFHGPKGVGFIYINGDNIINPIIIGGAQERNMRAGTENIMGIVGMEKAMELATSESAERKAHIDKLRTHLKTELLKIEPEIKFNGNQERYLHTVLSTSFPANEKADMIMFNLDINGISASAGSACSSGVEHDSPVLEAINHDPKRKTIRFSFSHLNTLEEIDYTVEKLKSFL
jgi:cysteine desulfurase